MVLRSCGAARLIVLPCIIALLSLPPPLSAWSLSCLPGASSGLRHLQASRLASSITRGGHAFLSPSRHVERPSRKDGSAQRTHLFCMSGKEFEDYGTRRATFEPTVPRYAVTISALIL